MTPRIALALAAGLALAVAAPPAHAEPEPEAAPEPEPEPEPEPDGEPAEEPPPAPEPPQKVVYPQRHVRQVPLPDTSLGYEQPTLYPTLAWALLQLVPSPELAFGRHRVSGPNGPRESGYLPSFGLRWEVTPLLWSFGVHPRQSRWRTFIVDPIARQSGSLELSGQLEYIAGHVDRVIPRSTLRLYLPVAQKGEYASVSLGTTAYEYDGVHVGYEVGAYLLAGMIGAQVTLAPAHAPLAAITTLRLRFF